MPRPFKKGIACHGGKLTHPFSRELFVDLDNDDVPDLLPRTSSYYFRMDFNFKVIVTP